MIHPPRLWKLPDRTLELAGPPLVMGIVNVTPDSFSDGGSFFDPALAIEQGVRLAAEGADLLDVGGESTRPGAVRVEESEELRRIEPVVAGLAAQVSIPVSIDTSKAAVAERALGLGARIINDVTACTGDPRMVEVARRWRAGLVLMHMQGTPATMQLDPRYGDVVREVREYLEQRLAALRDAGIEAERMVVDPGIGFGKRHAHNLELLRNLEATRAGDRPICLGVSRKGFIGKELGRPGREAADAGTVGVVLRAAARGAAEIVRVHNVALVRDAVKMFWTT